MRQWREAFESGHARAIGPPEMLKLIAQVVRHYLTRGWDTAHLQAPGSTVARTRLREDVLAGNVFRPV